MAHAKKICKVWPLLSCDRLLLAMVVVLVGPVCVRACVRVLFPGGVLHIAAVGYG